MQPLKIQNLSFSYPSASFSILQDIHLELHQGWTGVVGANGSGKSTLLKLIAKELFPADGSITGNDLVYYCQQSTEYEPKEMEDFMQTYTSKAFKIRDALAIKDEWLGMWQELTHGQRKRVQIAIALYLEPDILLLDEPTNHLDKKNKHIIIQALEAFDGIGILVSHDRELLDKLTAQTVLLKNMHTIVIKTNYSQAKKEYEKDLEYKRRKQEETNEAIKKVQQSIYAQQEKVLQSKKRLSKKHIDKNDSDMKAKINLAKLTGKDKKDADTIKRLASKQRHLEENSTLIEKKHKTGIVFQSAGTQRLFPLMIKKEKISFYANHTLLWHTMQIEENDKIGIIGENGSGKSTFITYLLQTLDFKDKVLYIPQEIQEQQSKMIFDSIKKYSNDTKGEIFTIIRRLMSDPKTLLESHSPSPGETRKLLFAQGLLAQPSVIILDEPTNHMDIESIHMLEEALHDYHKALLLVSHDEVFLKNIVNKIWSFKKIGAHTYEIEERVL